MKKLLLVILALAMIVSLTSCGGDPAETSSSTSGTVSREYTVVGTVLKNCKGQADANGVFVVPDGITEIGEGCFSGDTTLKEIVFADSVEKIAEGAFFSCSALQTVTFGTGLRLIGGGSFQYCTALKNLVIPDGVTVIGANAFYECTGLRSVSLPGTLERIDSYAFTLCSKLESIVIPDSVKVIGTCAFQACSSLSDVTLSHSLTEIPFQCFAQCSLLDTVNTADCPNLETISPYAFWNCTSLKRITLAEGLKYIRNYAFYSCSKLYQVTIPSTLVGAGAFAFDLTPYYKELSDDYVIVGDGVLLKCNRSAAYLDLSGKGIKTIGGAVFRNSQDYYEGTDDYGATTDYGYAQASYLDVLTLPEGIVRVEDSAFAGTGVMDIELPTTLEYIGANAFRECIQYGRNVMTGAFVYPDVDLSRCPNLSYIGTNAFVECYGLTKLDLPSDDIEIGAYAFFKTEAMYRFMESAYAGGEETAFFTSGNTLLWTYVAPGVTEITVPDGIVNVAGTAFCGWDSAMVIDDDYYDSLTSISADTLFLRNQYYLGYRITTVNLPETVKKIGAAAFVSMRVLNELALPDGVETLGNEAFMNCYALKSVSLGDSLRSVGDRAFQYCYMLESIAFPDSLTHAGDNLFYGCSSLKTVMFPEHLTDVGYQLFNTDCTSLHTLYLSPTLESRLYGIVGTLYQAAEAQSLTVRYYVSGEE